jgi:hypothetical protein
MNGVVLLGCIFTSKLEDDPGAAGVRGDEVGDVVDIAIQNNPATLWGIMLCDCCVSASCMLK